tara:strand:+ start:4982 stop:5344 length:363 start_codon:yes stop_codon:yes gene_type:complete
MFRQFSEQVVSDLHANTDLTDLLDASAVSALISEQEDGESFVNYFVMFDASASKDGAKNWQVKIESWSDTYDKSIAIADEVTNALEASSNYYDYISGKSEPVRIESKTFIITTQIFNIKK